MQQKIIPLFHYALNPAAFLFLGTSESVREYGDLFAVLDRRMKVYQRKGDIRSARREAIGRIVPPMAAEGNPADPGCGS